MFYKNLWSGLADAASGGFVGIVIMLIAAGHEFQEPLIITLFVGGILGAIIGWGSSWALQRLGGKKNK